MEATTVLASLLEKNDVCETIQDLAKTSSLASLGGDNVTGLGMSRSVDVESKSVTKDTVIKAGDESNNANVIKKKKKLSVNFKDGPELILGYLEPPDPWRNAQHWCAEDLENAYRRACTKHGIKPITSLLHQLKIFKNIRDRYEVLNLKGEKLDVKHCECLEEIFRRVQFRTLNFESTHLDDECAVALFDMVEHYESACKVDISFNKNLGVRGWQACARAIKRTPCLTHLDARSCNLNDLFIPIIGRSLRMGCHLVTLHVENASLAGRSLMILVAALKVNETLKELFLGDNKLMPTDAVHLGQLLNCNHTLSLLDLRNNPIQDTGLGHISDGLHKQNLGAGLHTLVLWNTQISFQGMNALSPALVSTMSLQTLNLAHNNINNEGIFRLKESLLSNKSLLRIGLQACKLSCEAAIALAEVIADSWHLLRVDLRENDIRTAGLMALSLALKVNSIVTKLDLDKEPKREPSMKDYAEQQRRLQQDISDSLAKNQTKSALSEQERRKAITETIQLADDVPRQKPESKATDIDDGTTLVERPGELVTSGYRQESLDSPAWIPDQISTDDAVPLIPLVPETLCLDTVEDVAMPDFILSPQYQNSGSPLLPIGCYDSFVGIPPTLTPKSSVTLLPVNETDTDVGAKKYNGRKNDADDDGKFSDLKHFCHSDVQDVLNEMVNLTVLNADGSQEYSCSSSLHIPSDILSRGFSTACHISKTVDSYARGFSANSSDVVYSSECAASHGDELATNCDKGNHVNNTAKPEFSTVPTNIPLTINDRPMKPKTHPSSSSEIQNCQEHSCEFTGISETAHKPASVNGIIPELTSAFNTLNICNGTQEEPSTTPDEFERELDAMLADIRGGWSTSLAMVSNKSPDQILQDAMATIDQ